MSRHLLLRTTTYNAELTNVGFAVSVTFSQLVKWKWNDEEISESTTTIRSIWLHLQRKFCKISREARKEGGVRKGNIHAGKTTTSKPKINIKERITTGQVTTTVKQENAILIPLINCRCVRITQIFCTYLIW